MINKSYLFISIFLAPSLPFLSIFSNAGHKTILWPKEKDGFVSKWVYDFLPSQNHVHLSGYFKHHIGGGQLPKNRYEIL